MLTACGAWTGPTEICAKSGGPDGLGQNLLGFDCCARPFQPAWGLSPVSAGYGPPILRYLRQQGRPAWLLSCQQVGCVCCVGSALVSSLLTHTNDHDVVEGLVKGPNTVGCISCTGDGEGNREPDGQACGVMEDPSLVKIQAAARASGSWVTADMCGMVQDGLTMLALQVVAVAPSADLP